MLVSSIAPSLAFTSNEPRKIPKYPLWKRASLTAGALLGLAACPSGTEPTATNTVTATSTSTATATSTATEIPQNSATRALASKLSPSRYNYDLSKGAPPKWSWNDTFNNYLIDAVRVDDGKDDNYARYDVTATNKALNLSDGTTPEEYFFYPDKNGGKGELRVIPYDGSTQLIMDMDADGNTVLKSLDGEILITRKKAVKGDGKIIVAPTKAGSLKGELNDVRFDGNLVENIKYKTKALGQRIQGKFRNAPDATLSKAFKAIG